MESYVLRTLILLISLLIGARAAAQQSPGVNFWANRPDEELIEAILAEMSDEELLGQVFMLGYIGKKPSPEIMDWIENRNLGGVKIFGRNVGTLPSLAAGIGQMQMITAGNRFQIPLFMATDQEGGWVRHIKGKTSRTPGNLALGASGLPRDALLTGYYIGQELKSLGINMNFAPDIDVYTNPSANVIGPRAFSSDSRTTAFLALAYFKGLNRSGVICTAKHFPGHGHADKDSHGSLPVVEISLEQMWERELVPYRILIGEGLPAIMSGHLAYPQILGRVTPSSRSSYFIKEILRERLKFEGVLVTDDMEMNGAIHGGLTTMQASREALEAGNDMILISHTPRVQERTWQELIDHLRNSSSFKEKIRHSVRRILRLKLKTFKGNNPLPLYPDIVEIDSRLPAEGAESFFRESSMRSVTLLKAKHIPFRPNDGEKLLFIGQFQEFLTEGKLRYPMADTLKFPYSPFYFARNEQRWSIPRQAAGFDTIIFCLANYNSLEILKTLQSLGKKIIVISALTPVYLRETPWVESCLAVYGTDRGSFQAGFAALAGDFSPEGRLPIDFPDSSSSNP